MNAPTSPQTPIAVRCMDWLERVRKQASAYRKEDNGDESKWSIYSQGRADALDRMEEDLRRTISNVRISDGGLKASD